ncbi:ATP-binding protein, partial [Paenibacillus sp. ACRRX]|uniref:ATP-binding protein n=1 Tax=Paenibacillus sp. ACRRX TaxID=2918206 RepID=UPI001EF4F710
MPTVTVNLPAENLTSVLGNVTSPFVVVSELLKNGVDAGANAVTVIIDTTLGEVKIIDDGKGFTVEEITDLGTASESRKKREGNFRNPDGEMLLGSKGLAIFSAFSLGNEVKIITKNTENKAYKIDWIRSGKEFSYDEIDASNISEGTEVSISGINFSEMLLLSSEKELRKLKHISIRNFKKNSSIPKVILIKDSQYIDMEMKNIEDFSEDFTAKVSFVYNRKNNVLEYKYEVDDPRISKEKIVFKLSDSTNIK